MTQKNVEIMDVIVDKMTGGMSLAKALGFVYSKRRVCIPCKDEYYAAFLMDVKMSRRPINSLLRAKMRKIGDVIEFCKEKKITDIPGIGIDSGIEVFESILNYCWDHMSNDERTDFLIDTVERNSGYVRAGVV